MNDQQLKKLTKRLQKAALEFHNELVKDASLKDIGEETRKLATMRLLSVHDFLAVVLGLREVAPEVKEEEDKDAPSV